MNPNELCLGEQLRTRVGRFMLWDLCELAETEGAESHTFPCLCCEKGTNIGLNAELKMCVDKLLRVPLAYLTWSSTMQRKFCLLLAATRRRRRGVMCQHFSSFPTVSLQTVMVEECQDFHSDQVHQQLLLVVLLTGPPPFVDRGHLSKQKLNKYTKSAIKKLNFDKFAEFLTIKYKTAKVEKSL